MTSCLADPGVCFLPWQNTMSTKLVKFSPTAFVGQNFLCCHGAVAHIVEVRV